MQNRWSERKDLNQLNAVPQIPNHRDKWSRRIGWSVVSKAAVERLSKADDTPDFCCGTFVAQQSCATKVARVSYLVAESCNKLHNKNPNRDLLYFSATCLRLVVYVTQSSALCVNRNSCYLLQLFHFLKVICCLMALLTDMEWTELKVHEFAK